MLRILTLALLAIFTMTDVTAADKRPMTFDDLVGMKRVSDPRISPDGMRVVYEVKEVTDAAANKSHTHLWLATTDGKTPPRQLTSSGKRDAHARWSPDGTKILFESTRSGTSQLWLLDLAGGGEAKQLTTISTGAATGLWSPDGSHVAFVSAVHPEFSTLPFTESDAKNKEKDAAAEANVVKAKVFTKLFYRHWDDYVGDNRQHLFTIKIDGTGSHDATPGDRDAYPTSTTFSVGDDFTFTPDSKHLVFTAVPAEGPAWSTNHDLCRVTLDNAKTDWENLTAENKAADCSPQFSPDGKKLAWRRQAKAGYEADKWDIVTVDVQEDGRFASDAIKLRNLTAREAQSVSEFTFYSDVVIIFAADDRGQTPLYFLTAGAAEPRTELMEVGQCGSVTVGAGGRIVFSRAAMDHPPRVEITRLQAANGPGAAKVAADPNAERLNDLALSKPESINVKIEDGDMQMWVLKPPGFDDKKKWPVVYLVHGGPQGAWEDGWSARWNPQLWAAQGYVVAMPNPRGSTGFGQKFVDEISGDWGGKCYRDLMSGVEFLEKLIYVDKDRIGSAGGSFGGYMQNWFAVNTDKFKCLITHCSVYNFESMWGTTDELWFDEYEHGGLPWDIPGKYREFSPHTKAKNLGKFKTPMLIIHNDLDFRCPIGQGHELFSALQRQGVPSRFVNFPDEGHWVLKPANSRKWHAEVFAWLTKYVPPGGK